ncbi:hypothetical protein E3U43_007565, partial [Larimichthys crocea]
DILRSSLLSSLWSEAAIAIDYSKLVGAKGALTLSGGVGELIQQHWAACWHLHEPEKGASFLDSKQKCRCYIQTGVIRNGSYQQAVWEPHMTVIRGLPSSLAKRPGEMSNSHSGTGTLCRLAL